MMRRHLFLGTVLLSICLLGVPSFAASDEAPAAPSSLLLILDASGSMWGQIDGENKIVIARRVFDGLVDDLPDDAEVGLVAYGHRREGDCDDIETIVEIGPLDRAALKQTVQELNPKGKTPIAASVERAFANLANRREAATVILLSDGLETCGGDPCATVRSAREGDLQFVLHVVGFDLSDEDVSQLECAAQAGSGLFLTAENADELAGALDTAVALTPETPSGRLVVGATTDGELQDVALTVIDATSSEDVTVSRTYASAETNPRSIPLPDGQYEVQARALGIDGDVERRFDVEIRDGSRVEKSLDFTTGEISIGVLRNGELGDAVYRISVAATGDQVDQGRTYTDPSKNPATVRLTAGRYDVDVGSVEISDEPKHRFDTVEVTPGGEVELRHTFASGELRIGASHGEDLVDAVVRVVDADGSPVAQGRTYTRAASNPKTFVLSPGTYVVELKTLRLEGKPEHSLVVEVEAEGSHEEIVDFAD